jgi:hypothetical protein
VGACKGRDSPYIATTLSLSVAPVNLELGCSLDEFGDVVAAEEGPGTLPSSGRAFGGLYAEEKQNPAGERCGFGRTGFDILSDGKAIEPKRAG